ncbi:unnamed protein product [Staurois parvus]|uniref:Uncharacterized protein n=1 Tax=Staurois parvus TaxID=386267 RepID=A0ABN9AWS5_9NEOB|nr:unnamed protein product [Staurois parvus]
MPFCLLHTAKRKCAQPVGEVFQPNRIHRRSKAYEKRGGLTTHGAPGQ